MRDKEKYNTYLNNYMKNKYRERRDWAIDFLGGKCVICGSTENLEIDHVDAELKEYKLAKCLHTISKEKFENEINKCQLLCINCHRVKSKLDISKKLSGERNPKALLTSTQVKKIRSLLEAGTSLTELSTLYKVNIWVIRGVRDGTRYTSVC